MAKTKDLVLRPNKALLIHAFIFIDITIIMSASEEPVLSALIGMFR
jgi:hypothetical protein